MVSAELKREIGLAGAVAYGIGIIIGAGVYALIGKAAGYSGNAVWLSFIIAAAVASFSGLSYAELSSRFPSSGAEFVYVEKASGARTLAFMVGWLVFFSGIVSASTVALGFGGYLMAYTGTLPALSAIGLVIALSILNLVGIKESMRVNIVMTIVEVGGLLVVIALGAGYLGSVNYFEMPLGFGGVVTAAAIIFFAYIGFEAIVKLGDETKDPRRTIPRALIISLIISTVLYALVGLLVISIVPYEQLASSTSPIADVALTAGGPPAYLTLSIIALFATANTVLIILIATSRIIYGISKETGISVLSRIQGKRGTPYAAVLITMVAAVAFSLLGDIELLASVTNFSTFIVFIAVNLALLVLKYRFPKADAASKSYLTIKNISVVAVLGAASSFVMLFQYDALVAGVTAIVASIGIVIYWIISRKLEKRV